MDDNDMIRAAQQGDQDAWQALYEKYARQVYAYLYRVTTGDYELDDLCSITWMRVWLGLYRYEPQRPFMAWLSVVARHVWWQEAAKRRSIQAQRYYGEPPAEDDIPETAMRRVFAGELITRLPKPIQREVMRLHVLDGWPYADLAARFQCSERDVSYAYERAIQYLRRELEGIPHPRHGGNRAPAIPPTEQRRVAARVARGELTQVQAAQEYGVSQATISKYCGRRMGAMRAAVEAVEEERKRA